MAKGLREGEAVVGENRQADPEVSRLMEGVVRVSEQGKVEDMGLDALTARPEVGGVDAKVALIQGLIPLGLAAVPSVLLGLSCRDYKACAEMVPEAFDAAPRRFPAGSVGPVRSSFRPSRRGDWRPTTSWPCFWMGRPSPRTRWSLSWASPAPARRKVVVGFVQTATENEPVCAAFLRELVDRGLQCDHGLHCVIDGVKGIRKAVQTPFGAVIQRCQCHKRENVLEYLPKSQRANWRREFQAAYARPTYAEANTALLRVRTELRLLNESAVKSLEGGLEETLTPHRLGVFPSLGVSLKTTNCLEPLTALVGQRTVTVDRWRSSD